MTKLPVLKKQNKAYLELPAEMLNCEELEIFTLKEGFYLLSKPLGRKPIEKNTQEKITEPERNLLKKLLSIRFQNRSPSYVATVLNKSEKEILKALEQKGFVNVFRGKKYQNGVYNINDRIYPLLRENAPKKTDRKPIANLRAKGYAIIADKKEAFALSQMLNTKTSKDAVVGIKGFDGKFYVATRNYLSKAQSSIYPVLEGDMDSMEIAKAANLDHEGCITVLRIMAENGDIIEKKKGIFHII